MYIKKYGEFYLFPELAPQKYGQSMAISLRYNKVFWFKYVYYLSLVFRWWNWKVTFSAQFNYEFSNYLNSLRASFSSKMSLAAFLNIFILKFYGKPTIWIKFNISKFVVYDMGRTSLTKSMEVSFKGHVSSFFLFIFPSFYFILIFVVIYS